MNSLSVKAKFQMDNLIKSLKQIFCKLKANLTLKVKVKVTSFQTLLRPLCDQYMVQVEGKLPNGSTCCIHKESLKIFKFQGQFDLEGPGQGHQFSNLSETSINSLILE